MEPLVRAMHFICCMPLNWPQILLRSLALLAAFMNHVEVSDT